MHGTKFRRCCHCQSQSLVFDPCLSIVGFLVRATKTHRIGSQDHNLLSWNSYCSSDVCRNASLMLRCSNAPRKERPVHSMQKPICKCLPLAPSPLGLFPMDHLVLHVDPWTYPITAFMLRLSKNALRSSFLTSTTQCSKLSIFTLAFVSSTTSWNAFPNRFVP